MRDSAPQPVRITVVGNFEGSKLGEEPGNDQCNRSWHDQPRRSAKGRFSKSGQSGWNVPRFCLPQWFDCTHVASEEGEHCNSNSSLPWQPKERKLEQLRCGILTIARRPKAVIPCSAQMCNNHPEGSNTSNALIFVRRRIYMNQPRYIPQPTSRSA